MTSGTLQLTLDASNDGYLEIPYQGDWTTLIELGPPGNVVPTERTFPLFTQVDVTYFNATLGIMQQATNGALIVATAPVHIRAKAITLIYLGPTKTQ